MFLIKIEVNRYGASPSSCFVPNNSSIDNLTVGFQGPVDFRFELVCCSGSTLIPGACFQQAYNADLKAWKLAQEFY